MKLPSLAIGAAVALGLFTSTPAARANGRYPAAGQIAVDPADPMHILIRATYGFVTTTDGGAHWSWICENAVGFSGNDDPMVAITKDGSLLAGFFAGLSVTHDRGCQWDFVKGGIENRFVVDLSTERMDPASAVLVISKGLAKDKFLTQLWQSPDNARTWTQAGTDLSETFLGLTVDTAPSDPARVYVSGRFGSAELYQGALQRSKDRGTTWESLPIPGSNDLFLPYIAAIDPQNPDVVYVRLDGDKSDGLHVSKDGGATWNQAFTAQSLLGFALSPDGSTIAVGSDKDGLWTAPTSSLAFTKVSSVGVRCLTWTAQGLYACADEFADGFTAGLSTDNGKTFSPILHVQTLCGPLECDPASSTGKECPLLWGATKLSIGACMADADAGSGDASASASAGSSSSSSSGSSGISAVGGCGCSAPGEVRSGALTGLAALGLAALLGMRRRDRLRGR